MSVTPTAKGFGEYEYGVPGQIVAPLWSALSVAYLGRAHSFAAAALRSHL